MRIDTVAHAARTAEKNANAVRISTLDPETATREQCEAALKYMFTQHPHCKTFNFRAPQVLSKGDGTFVVMINGNGPMPKDLMTPNAAFNLGKCEGLFLGELLAPISTAERPLCGQEQCVTSLKPLAKAIITMANNHQWDHTLVTFARAVG